MTCHICTAWAARTERQLQHRLDRMKENPDVQLMQCFSCFGTDWATTRDFIPTPTLADRRRREHTHVALILVAGIVISLAVISMHLWRWP